MKSITGKENMMMFMRGEHPAWVPRYCVMPDPYSKLAPPMQAISPGFMNEHRTPEGGRDIWGVEFVATEETAGAVLPVPNQFILDDITKWRDVVKAPDISGIDWEAMAKKDLEKVDRSVTAVVQYVHVGYFQQLMAFMGFGEGLCAMFEEPEEVKALYDYLCDFYTGITKKCLEYYKPDFFELTDDTATAINPFVSVDMYRDLIKPYHKAQMQPVMDEGLPIFMHNCGRCEDFIEDWFDCGIVAWNPAQVVNDLDGIKKKYGRKFGLCGCWDSSGPVSWPDATEEMIKQAVRDTIDRFAPDGGFCFWGSTYGPVGDKATEDRKRWLTEEYESYGMSFYD